MSTVQEGHIPFKGYKTYYKIVGKPATGTFSLLVLHGGPGGAHNYMLSLSALAREGRQVIFYDQLGCGKSDNPDDDSIWTIQLFIDELRALRKELGLKEIHLLGQSWGGMLAIDYLLTKPKGIQSLVLASSMISMPLYQAEVEKLKQALPKKTYLALKKHEAAGTTNSKEYTQAYAIYRKHHLYRSDDFPDKYERPRGTKGDIPYTKLWGVSEAYANGSLKTWDRIDKLHEITIPTLITSGQYDELTPWQAGLTRDKIPNSRLKIFTNGSHLVHIEQEKDYVKTIAEFLTEVER